MENLPVEVKNFHKEAPHSKIAIREQGLGEAYLPAPRFTIAIGEQRAGDPYLPAQIPWSQGSGWLILISQYQPCGHGPSTGVGDKDLPALQSRS